jgi:tricorn protease
MQNNKTMKKLRPLFLTLLFLSTFSLLSAQNALMRFPDIHQDLVTFVSGEDIWTVPADGGIATRITFHDGAERFPMFSPDGSLIAFTGAYDGNSDIYVMNKYGGNITRLTFNPSFDEVVGWHPVKNKIVFWSTRMGYANFLKLFLISPDGSGLEQVPMYEVSRGSFSPDGNRIAYNRMSRENRTWKRYKGGTAQEVYVYDFNTEIETKITNFEGTDRYPMWINDKIYFVSDRDNVLNIYAYDVNDEKIEQVTSHTNYDIRRPGYDNDNIIYELGGKLMVLNLETKKTTGILVEIYNDAPETRPYLKEVKKLITDIDCSPAGEKALIVARGEIFTVSAEKQITKNLTKSSGSREKDAVWSPNGKMIAYFSDAAGEYNIYIADTDGNNAEKLTDFKDGYRHTLKWSPDNEKIAFTDQTLRLFVLDITSQNIIEVDRALYEHVDVSLDLKPIYDYNWSPDSRFITYSKMDEDLVYKIYIYSMDDKTRSCVSTIFNDFHPVFSADGKYLFFISNRRFVPTYCDFEWQMVYKKVAGIYVMTLQKGVDGLLVAKEDLLESDKVDTKDNDEAISVKIDFDGITDRIEALPLKRGNYRYLATNDKGLFFLNKDEGDFNRFEFRSYGPMDLYRFSFEDKKEKKIMETVDEYKLSDNGKKVIYKKGETVGIVESGKNDLKGDAVKLEDLKMKLDPKLEWNQIFNEAWRMERDFYYEPGMHGLNWDEMKVKYGSLMDLATCRQDVQYIIGEMIGELNTSHTYVYGGDRKRKGDRVGTGLLGADYIVDEENGRWQFEKIFKVSDWSRGVYPPLAQPGIDVNEGDYLLQVNGENVTTEENIFSYFEGLTGKHVTIMVNREPSMDGARTIIVKPVGNDYQLRYQAWAEHNRKVVEKESNGLIGYVHFPDTYLGSATEFGKYYYSQTRKKGIILDGRYNGGGLDPDIFHKRFLNAPHSYWTRRYSHDQTSPFFAVNTHMACLTNRQAGSGGDEFPQEFQQFNMGPVIGTRTWGGLVGVSMFISLIDGGGLTAPDYRIYLEDGSWIVENEGITPDIIIEQGQAEMLKGDDKQLKKAIQVLMDQIREDPKPWPEHNAFPANNAK